MKELPKIYGFNELAEAGIRGGEKIYASAIFLGKCNLRCPYCMNSKLVFEQYVKTVDLQVAKDCFDEGGCEMLMITGGEPTMACTKRLKNLIEEIKSWGCKVGISTNGLMSRRLKEIIKDLDYVAMDLKTSPLNYTTIGCLDISDTCKSLVKTINLLSRESLKRKDFCYEIRTTLYPPLVTEDMIRVMSSYIPDDATWALQYYRKAKNMLDPKAYDVDPYSESEIDDIIALIRDSRPDINIEIRYV